MKHSRIFSYPDFWHHSSEGLRWVLTHQVWQVHNHTGSLDVLPRADHNTGQQHRNNIQRACTVWRTNMEEKPITMGSSCGVISLSLNVYRDINKKNKTPEESRRDCWGLIGVT